MKQESGSETIPNRLGAELSLRMTNFFGKRFVVELMRENNGEEWYQMNKGILDLTLVSTHHDIEDVRNEDLKISLRTVFNHYSEKLDEFLQLIKQGKKDEAIEFFQGIFSSNQQED